MAKVIQLMFIKTFVSPLTEGKTINKGDIIKVSDEVFAKLDRARGGQQVDSASNVHKHWQERDESLVKLTHDFTKSATAAQNIDAKDHVGAATASNNEASPARTTKPAQRVARKTT